jgi:hypothetical protein
MKTLSWCLALAGVIVLAGTTHAGSPRLSALLLPQIFGQEPNSQSSEAAQAPAATQPQPAPSPTAPALDPAQLRDLLQKYTQAWAWFSERSTKNTPSATGPELLPMPRVVTGNVPDGGTVLIGGGLKVFVPPQDACPAENLSACKPGPGCVCPKPDLSAVAGGCDNTGCCEAAKKVWFKVMFATKACKCCEDCKDCKDCTCGDKKKTALPYAMPFRTVVAQPCPMPAPAIALQPFPHPVPCMPVPPPPACPTDELTELMRQKQQISAAIADIEQQLVRLAEQKRMIVQVEQHLVHQAQQKQIVKAAAIQVAHNAQKVHLMTEHFEAHCDAIHCQDGDASRLVLEGNVRLTCKTKGHATRIEAARVVINTRDGTFSVGSVQNTAPVAVPTGRWDIRVLPWAHPPIDLVPVGAFLPGESILMPNPRWEVEFRLLPRTFPEPPTAPDAQWWHGPFLPEDLCPRPSVYSPY